MTTKTFIIADDHPLFREALKGIVNQQFSGDLDIVEAQDISTLQTAVEAQRHADLILMDLHMPGAHGFSGLVFLASHFPEIPVMIVSANESPDIIGRAIDHGAAGFLPKVSPPETMLEAIDAVLAGDIWIPEAWRNRTQGSAIEEQDVAAALGSLTPQQFKVATMLAQGLLNKQIAFELNVTEATIKAHMTEIFRKLNVRSRTQAALAIGQLDIEQPGSEI